MTDSYSAPTIVGAEPTEDQEELFNTLKGWVSKDWERSSEWRRQAKEDFAFVAGDQWTEEDKAALREQLRPLITMNRIDPIIDSVSGSEVANRQEVRYLPREQGDVQVNEVLTSAAQWFRDQCDAEDEESDAFRDTIICGMGWIETRLDYETEPDGEPKIERVDPLDLGWDSSVSKRNLSDCRRIAHVRKLPLAEAKALCPDHEDEDYHAAWVEGVERGDTDEPTIIDPRNRYRGNDDDKDGDEVDDQTKTVTLVRIQWWERKPAYRVVDPTNPQNILDLDTKKQADDIQAKVMMATGQQIKVVRSIKRVYRQAYLGAKLLEEGPAPCKEHFSFNCITGKRDRNANQWYGLVRGMKDPQRWANKWLSQSLHILNSSAKGGILAERGAFDNDKDAEKSWAKQDVITFAKSGALAAGKIQPKPASPLPAGFYQLMEFAISSIRDTSGVNIETLGMREAQQAASLEHMRKQSSMTILQPLFDSLRRYRKMQGRQMLYIIREFLSDGRLVRIVGKEGEQYVPLIKSQGVEKYDVIVDESPTSPNQKEHTWDLLQAILPAVGKMIPPQTWIALLKYSPLPTSAVEEIKASIEPPKGPDGQPLPPPPDPEVVKAKTEMEIAQQRSQAEQDLKQQSMRFEMDMAFQKATQEAELEKQKSDNAIQLAREKQAADIDLAHEKLAHEAGMAAQKAVLDADIATRRAEDESEIASQKAAADAEIARKRAAQKPAPARTNGG